MSIDPAEYLEDSPYAKHPVVTFVSIAKVSRFGRKRMVVDVSVRLIKRELCYAEEMDNSLR